MAVLFIIIVWIVFTFILAFVANSKGCSFRTYFLIGLLLSPLVGFIILHIMGRNKETLQNGNLSNGITKKCLVCGEMVDNNVKICPYCKRSIFQGDIEEENDEDYEGDEIYEDDEEVDENLKNSLDIIFSAAGRTNEHDENEFDYAEEEKKDDYERYSRHDKKRDFANDRDKHSEREEKTVSNNNKGTVGVRYYYCKHCGVKNSSVTGLINSSGCILSPTKKHELYEGSEKSQYICKYCGVKNSSIKGLLFSSGCLKSPTKKHEPAL